MGLQNLIGALKAKNQAGQVKKRIYTTFKNKMTSPGIAGEKNYNIEQRTLKSYANNMDAQGASNYAKGQRAKLSSQIKKAKSY